MGLRGKRAGATSTLRTGGCNKQRYLCKGCGLTFTDTPPRGKPLALKVAAVLLYVIRFPADHFGWTGLGHQ